MTDKQIICKCNDKECGQCSFEEQLKRKEQECEELKEKCKKYGEINEQETKDYAQLKAENEELKKKCNIYTCGICGNKEDCNKLYKTLTEIKEIAEEIEDECGYLGWSSCANKAKEQILQKISEVIPNE